MADTQADDRAPSLAHAVAPPERLKPKAAFPLAALCGVCGCGFGAQVYELRVAGRRRKERENTVFLVCGGGVQKRGPGREVPASRWQASSVVFPQGCKCSLAVSETIVNGYAACDRPAPRHLRHGRGRMQHLYRLSRCIILRVRSPAGTNNKLQAHARAVVTFRNGQHVFHIRMITLAGASISR